MSDLEGFSIIFIFFGLCGVLAYLAEKKGRSSGKMFFLSLLTSPIVGAVVYMVLSAKQTCPECAEKIPAEARTCSHCQTSLTVAR